MTPLPLDQLRALHSRSDFDAPLLDLAYFVLLESADHYTFVVPRRVACGSGVLKSMLDEEGMPSRYFIFDLI